MVEDAEFTIVSRARRTPVIVEFELRPVGSPMGHLPGQYVLLGDLDHRVPVRSYSIANAPRPDGRITVLVTRVAGGETSTWLHDRLRLGDPLLVSGPYGTFVAAAGSTRPVLCLAGGSGLAPIRALAEQAVRSGASRPFTVLLSARTRADVMDVELFADWGLRDPGLLFLRTLTREHGAPPLGHVPELLPRLFTDLSEHEVYVAGGPGFVSAAARACRALGAPARRVHTEEFFADPRPWTVPPAPAPAVAAVAGVPR
jgi:CDP-4-dehydro-6-deoxyglucose reductase